MCTCQAVAKVNSFKTDAELEQENKQITELNKFMTTNIYNETADRTCQFRL
jgi:hypothetical protein